MAHHTHESSWVNQKALKSPKPTEVYSHGHKTLGIKRFTYGHDRSYIHLKLK
jgi:hypothetical protein